MFKIILDIITITVCVVALSGCGHEVPALPSLSPTPTQNPADTSAPSITVVATATPTPAPISITYYSKTVTRQPNPNKFYTATGYCLTYNSKTYCWDDGVHSIVYSSSSTGHYTYWMLSDEHLTTNPAPITSPALVNQTFTNHILSSGGSVAEVFSGTPTTVSCTDDGAGVLNCGAFIVDPNQVGL
jgi:hypothetical protein